MLLNSVALFAQLPEPRTEPILGARAPALSPDGGQIAFVYRGDIWVAPSGGGRAVPITRYIAYDSNPLWSPDGKYLFFFSNRAGSALYAIPLTRETARRDDKDIQFEKPKEGEPLEVKIDFEDIDQRIRRWNNQAPQSDLTVASDGKIYFVSEGDVWQVSYDGSESRRLTSGGRRRRVYGESFAPRDLWRARRASAVPERLRAFWKQGWRSVSVEVRGWERARQVWFGVCRRRDWGRQVFLGV